MPRQLDHARGSLGRFLRAADYSYFSLRHTMAKNPNAEIIFVDQLKRKIPNPTRNMSFTHQRYALFKRELLREANIQKTFATKIRPANETFAEHVARIVVEKLQPYLVSYRPERYHAPPREFNNFVNSRRPTYRKRSGPRRNQKLFQRFHHAPDASAPFRTGPPHASGPIDPSNRMTN